MLPSRYIQPLSVGASYDRPTLARLWGHAGHQAFSRGVFTPVNTNLIFLFVTREKQSCLTQYQDFLDGDLLFWEALFQSGRYGTPDTLGGRARGSVASEDAIRITEHNALGRLPPTDSGQ